MNKDREELAWSAGLFDGEGCIGCFFNKRKNAPKAYPELVLTVSQLDRRVLDRFQKATGLGKVYGPYKNSGSKNYHHRFQSYGPKEVELIIDLLWEWLSPVKREQAKNALSTYKALPHPAENWKRKPTNE